MMRCYADQHYIKLLHLYHSCDAHYNYSSVLLLESAQWDARLALLHSISTLLHYYKNEICCIS